SSSSSDAATAPHADHEFRQILPKSRRAACYDWCHCADLPHPPDPSHRHSVRAGTPHRPDLLLMSILNRSGTPSAAVGSHVTTFLDLFAGRIAVLIAARYRKSGGGWCSA